MRELRERPPLWDEIDKAFNVAGKPVLFAFGGIIYNPEGGKITRELIAHEEIHGQRQGPTADDCFAWWRRYIADPGFRLQEEIPAHQAEYKAYCKRHGSGRDKALNFIAGKLASPLYGNLITVQQASRILSEPVDWKVVGGEVLHPNTILYGGSAGGGKTAQTIPETLLVFDKSSEMTKEMWDKAAQLVKDKP